MRKPTLLSEESIEAWVVDHPPDGISHLTDALQLGVLSDIEAAYVRRWLLNKYGVLNSPAAPMAAEEQRAPSAIWVIARLLLLVGLVCLLAWAIFGDVHD